jgi:DNA-binding NarL/FixJ family response regulator
VKRSRVLIADDHAIAVEGLRRILDRPEFEVVGVANDGRALLQAAAELQPDAIITDVAMPLLNGIHATREIHKHNPKPKIIF